MSIQMGILCEKCHTVHFIVTSHGIKPMPTPGMYVVSCGVCSERREFRTETMRPYRVSEEVFQTGHANEGEYFAIPPSAKNKS